MDMWRGAEIPLGWHFEPSDDEIIAILCSKLQQQQQQGQGGHFDHHLCHVTDVDVFAETPPWDLFKNYNAEDDDNDVRYFFTPLKKIGKNAKSKNFKRSVGEVGTWKTATTATEIRHPTTNQLIGSQRYLAFELIRSGKRKRTAATAAVTGDVSNKFTWGMHEFILEASNQGADFAICKITRKPNKSYVDPVPAILVSCSPLLSDHQPPSPEFAFADGFPEIPELGVADVGFSEIPPLDLDDEQWNFLLTSFC